MHVYYRFSDSTNGGTSKPRPEGFCKRKVFENFIRVFSTSNIHVIADRVRSDTAEWLRTKCSDVEVTNIGNGGDSTCWAFERALKECSPGDVVYFCEDDYWHRDASETVLQEGLTLAHYATLYDHPDKYMNGVNPFIQHHEGEVTLVRRTPSVHWKYTNSTTLTFATTYEVLRQDHEILKKHCGDGKSHDFQLFCELRDCGRGLVSPMPGYSTHIHIPWITPELVDLIIEGLSCE